ncbi:MAG: hypothetical protein JO320_08710 [Alphaproteobacteria bacterium]|nr:hypothetical protein [Alphaproteobacteria bacterium]
MSSHYANQALGALAAAALASAAVPAHAVTYTFQDIIDPVNPTFTQALGINDAGAIVGYGNMTIFNGFQLVFPPPPGVFTRLNVPGQTGGTQVFGITANALTTDGFSVSAAGVNSGFVSTGGVFTRSFKMPLPSCSASTHQARPRPAIRPPTRPAWSVRPQ